MIAKREDSDDGEKYEKNKLVLSISVEICRGQSSSILHRIALMRDRESRSNFIERDHTIDSLKCGSNDPMTFHHCPLFQWIFILIVSNWRDWNSIFRFVLLSWNVETTRFCECVKSIREEEWTENQIMTVNSFLSDAIKHKTYLWAWNTCACTMLNANKHELTTREMWNECCDSEITRHNHISSMMATAEEERENSHNFKFSPWKKKTTLTDELTKI